jgi:hypothetical protein
MAKGNKTTVTHPNGQVSTRTSQSRIYTHAVVISRTRQSMVDDELDQAAEYDSRALTAKRAIDGEVTESSRTWSRGLTYTSLFLGGEYAGAHVSDEPRPSDDQLREEMRERVSRNLAQVSLHRAKAAKIAAGPEMAYGVLRWSSRADLAESAARGEFSALVKPGVKIEAVPVD